MGIWVLHSLVAILLRRVLTCSYRSNIWTIWIYGVCPVRVQCHSKKLDSLMQCLPLLFFCFSSIFLVLLRSLTLLIREVLAGSVFLPAMDYLADPVSSRLSRHRHRRIGIEPYLHSPGTCLAITLVNPVQCKLSQTEITICCSYYLCLEIPGIVWYIH